MTTTQDLFNESNSDFLSSDFSSGALSIGDFEDEDPPAAFSRSNTDESIKMRAARIRKQLRQAQRGRRVMLRKERSQASLLSSLETEDQTFPTTSRRRPSRRSSISGSAEGTRRSSSKPRANRRGSTSAGTSDRRRVKADGGRSSGRSSIMENASP